MITCPHYRGSGVMGKHDEVCKYLMQDLEKKWCLCKHPAMILSEEEKWRTRSKMRGNRNE